MMGGVFGSESLKCWPGYLLLVGRRRRRRSRIDDACSSSWMVKEIGVWSLEYGVKVGDADGGFEDGEWLRVDGVVV